MIRIACVIAILTTSSSHRLLFQHLLIANKHHTYVMSNHVRPLWQVGYPLVTLKMLEQIFHLLLGFLKTLYLQFTGIYIRGGGDICNHSAHVGGVGKEHFPNPKHIVYLDHAGMECMHVVLYCSH
jgi:hypothetical protein